VSVPPESVKLPAPANSEATVRPPLKTPVPPVCTNAPEPAPLPMMVPPPLPDPTISLPAERR
jgi:hypothetical protein